MPELALGDDAYKIFLNASGNVKGMSGKLAAFLRFIKTNEATDSFTEKLDRCVRNAAEHKEWRLEYMTLQQKYREEYEAGIEQGKYQERQNTAKKLVQMQMPVEQIAQAVGESVATIEQWLAEK